MLFPIWVYPLGIVLIPLVLVTVAYKKKKFDSLPTTKPKIWFLPKYQFKVWDSNTNKSIHPSSIQGRMSHLRIVETLTDPNRSSSFLELPRQENINNRKSDDDAILLQDDDNNELIFTTKTGSRYGDFSLEFVKAKVSIQPQKNLIRVEYDAIWGVAFDTGDLWEFAQRIKAVLDDNNDNQ
ncbi:unnamed protein product [Cylindrotheca closterium]|uniref:Uncharacterized protein n=1 Tax=Cylindrotheca closterium TaxID=2856 RepID=A0AAD2FX34_9STRA|nr:unnamed protein product [Cylindrotheca closterium]